ncbi:MAG: hypothetical protein IH921_08620 [Gemmatimonadetes bacterium]|nr:hypothetical protein [Gemmatimonadota bacterium]
MNTALQRLLLLGIVIVATGCDNVEWGGIDVSLRRPSDDRVSDPSPPDVEVVEDTVSDGPSLGPVLYMGYRDGDQATLVPVAEIRPEGLFPLEAVGSVEASRAFMAEHLTPGLEFTLFSDGARVGRLIADRFSVDGRYCSARPQIRGPIELTPVAAAVETFLALPAREGNAFEYGAYSPVDQTRDLRVTSLTAMQEIIPSVGALWPVSVLGIRQDVQMFRATPNGAPTVVATFVYADDLRVGPAALGAYSVFLASDDDGVGYRGTYVDYRLFSRDGKGAARYFDHLDVDGDGSEEMVLEVMGEDAMWLSTLGRQGGSWVEEYRDPCGLPPRSSEPAN